MIPMAVTRCELVTRHLDWAVALHVDNFDTLDTVMQKALGDLLFQHTVESFTEAIISCAVTPVSRIATNPRRTPVPWLSRTAQICARR